MCVCGVNLNQAHPFKWDFNSMLRYLVHRMPGLCTIIMDPSISSGMMKAIGRKKEATPRVLGACSHGKAALAKLCRPWYAGGAITLSSIKAANILESKVEREVTDEK
jgi:hypothetical protein